MARGHLILSQCAGLVARNASGAAQRFNSLKILDENIHILHLDSSKSQCDSELMKEVKPKMNAQTTTQTCGSSPSGTLATMMPMAKISAF
jgi:hypothetical protein